MTPTDKFMNENEFFTCPGLDDIPCKMAIAECARLQKRAKASKKGTVKDTYGNFTHDLSRCLTCRTGKKNLLKSVGKVKTVIVPGLYEEYNVKTCACGKKFTRDHSKRSFSWKNTVLCDQCKELTKKKREEKISKIKEIKVFAMQFKQALIELKMKVNA